MARFSGKIGYATQTEKAKDVWVDTITEKSYYGDITRDSKRWYPSTDIINTIKIVNKISIVADSYANNNFENIRYVVWRGRRFNVDNIEVTHPRLTLTLGGTYNGPVPINP